MYVNVSMIWAPNTNIMEYENNLSPSSFSRSFVRNQIILKLSLLKFDLSYGGRVFEVV